MYGENIFSEHYWENCTTQDYAPMIVQGIGRSLEKHSLESLVRKFQDRSLRILEVGSGNGELLKAFQIAGFHDVRGLDMNPRHMRKYPELEDIVEIDAIQMKRIEKKEDRFDLVYTNLVFDEDCYREQKNGGFRSNMLQGIYSCLRPQGLFYGDETHQISEIITEIQSIQPRANSLVCKYNRRFIPSLN